MYHQVLLCHYHCCCSTCSHLDLAGYIKIDYKSMQRWFLKVQTSTCLSHICQIVPSTGDNTLLPWSYRLISGWFNVIFKRGESGIHSAERLFKLAKFYTKDSRSQCKHSVGHSIILILTSVPLMRRRAEQIWLWNKEDFTWGTTLCQKIFPLLSYLR